MNRTDRLLAIVLELQGKGVQRAEDLAATFEVSKRTIYRDVLALCEAGVPVVSEPGRGYSLVQGYFLPPLRFSVEEATMLLLGSDVMAQSFDAEYQTAAQSASRKIAGVLPEEVRADVAGLQHSIHFIPDGSFNRTGDTMLLQQLRQAIIKRQRVRFAYRARHSSDGTDTTLTREADPYGLAHLTGTWYLNAFCHLRGDLRHFRLDRMEHLAVLDTTFTRPANFVMDDQPDTRNVLVRALFAPQVAQWVHESRLFYIVGEEPHNDGLLVTLRVHQETELVAWLLSWGKHVQVLEPATLRERLIAEAQGIMQRYEQPESLLT